MAFNEDQIFYACLWWAKHLPGGKEQADAICARYQKPQVTFPYFAAKREPYEAHEISTSNAARQFNQLGTKAQLSKIQDGSFDQEAMAEMEEPLPPEQIDLFFDELFQETKRVTADLEANNQHIRFYFLAMEQYGTKSGTKHFPFSDEIEIALNRANFPRGKLPQQGCVEIYNDGRMFVKETLSEDSFRTVIFNYPEEPDLPYQYYAVAAEDMDVFPRLSKETTYRIVPLEEGQPYKWCMTTENGTRHISDGWEAGEGEAIFIRPQDFAGEEDFHLLSDADIINLHPSVKRFNVRYVQRVMDGEDYMSLEARVETTDSPHIIREYIDNIAYMEVKRPLQFGRRFDYEIAEPGDIIIREHAKASPRLVKKAQLEDGTYTFIFPQQGQPPAPGTSGPRWN